MSSYNNTIVPKIIDYVAGVVKLIGPKDQLGRDVRLLNYQMVATDNLDLNTLMSNRLTACYTVILEFGIFDSNGVQLNPERKITQELYIPRMINNIFIIEGTPRVPTQTLDNDWICRIYKDRVVINDYLFFPYAYNQSGVLEYQAETYDAMDEPLAFSMYMDWETPEIKQYLGLSDVERKKLQVKLDRDFIPEYIDKNLLEDLIALGPDMLKDSIVDKRITTTESDLINSLYKRLIRKNIITSIAKKFFQYESVYLKDIQNAIDRYFKVADDQTIDIPATVNPLVYDSLRYKITIPKHIAYNESMSDLIDAVNTPENNNVNRLNELNVCTELRDGVIYIKCYTIKGEKVTIPYLDYITTPVLSNQDYNYDESKVIKRPEYLIKLRLKTIKVTDLNQFKELLVEPRPDEKLSVTTRRIPMINVSDTVRIAMGSSMSKQAIEVEGSEPALVVSGNDDSDVVDSALITRYQGRDAVVEKIVGNRIFIKDETGSITYFEVSQPTVGANDSVISFEMKVKEGQKLTNDDIIIMPKILMNNSYELGVNARAFYMNYLGYSHEDGIIISESFAKKLTSYSIIEQSIHIKWKDIVLYLRPKGSKVVSGDILVASEVPLKGKSNTNINYQHSKGMLSGVGFTKNSNSLTVPNNVELGYVVDVRIEETTDQDYKTSSQVTREKIDQFLKDKVISSDWDNLPEKYKSLRCTETEIFDNDSFVITYKIIKVRPAIIGSKLCNRYGSKGEVSLILPDSLMPRLDEDGNGNGTPADILLNPPAIIARKNPSQLYEALMTKVIHVVYNKVRSLIAANNVEEAKQFTTTYYGTAFTKISDEEFLEIVKKGPTGFRMSVGSFLRIKYETLIQWAKDLGITEKQEVYCPDIILSDGPDGLKAYDPEQVNIDKIPNAKYHELGFLEQPIITGDTYIMKLFHSADYVGKVTPNTIESDEPYMKRGVYRNGGGQKIGEMEHWALLAYGTEGFVRDNKESITSQYEFLNELLLAGYVMVDSEGLPLLSDYRTRTK